jgi:peroxiredoxin
VHGETPDCHCFGQLRSAPVGWSTLGRNVALACVAALVLSVGPGASATGWLSGLGTGEIAAMTCGLLLAALAATQTAFSYQLLRQNGRLMARLEALEGQTPPAGGGRAAALRVGSTAPGFTLPALDGQALSLDSLIDRGRTVMLVFSHPRCDSCEALLSALGRWQREHADEVTIALIGQGDPAENEAQSREYGLRDVLLQTDHEVAEAYQTFSTPSALLVIDGAIASRLAEGAEQITTLLGQALNQVRPPLRVQTNGNSPSVGPFAAAGAGALAAVAVSGEASADSGAAAIQQILARAKPALVADGKRISAALEQRARHPKRVPSAAISAIGRERSLLNRLQRDVAAVRTRHRAKALTITALTLAAETQRALQRTLASTEVKDLQRHAAKTRSLSGRARDAISRAEKALR